MQCPTKNDRGERCLLTDGHSSGCVFPVLEAGSQVPYVLGLTYAVVLVTLLDLVR